jgi:hypothetical protein
LIGLLVSWLFVCLDGWLVGWLVGRSVGRSVGRFSGWLIGLRVSCLVDLLLEGNAKAAKVQKFIKLSAEFSAGIPLIHKQ